MPTLTPHPLLRRTTAEVDISKRRSWNDILKFITAGYWIDDAHWLHGPGVTSRPIFPESLPPSKGGQGFIQPVNAILHTNAGSRGSASLWSWLSRSTVRGEPHVQAGYKALEQYMPFNQRADCNFSANSWKESNGRICGAISFETQDNGAATLNETPWTMEQLHRMIGALTSLSVVYGIMCTEPATWNRSGIGHHSLFPFQGPLHKAWTNVRGKTCPGRARIAQMDWVRAQVADNMAAFVRETGHKCGQIGGT